MHAKRKNLVPNLNDAVRWIRPGRPAVRPVLLALLVGWTLLLTPTVFAAPLAVSPASDFGLADVEARCPGFSWTLVEGSVGYELVVVSAGADQAATTRVEEPVLRVRLPQGATSWTPTLGDCLSSGERYAWSVRALGPRADGDWSEPSLFRIAPAGTAPELEQALAVVRQHLAETDSADRSMVGSVTDRRSSTGASPAAQTDRSAQTRGTGTDFEVDGSGNVVASSFSGDGSGLTGVTASALGLSVDPPNCGAGFAPTGINANGNAQGCFDTATQGDLNLHKTSGDHDGRYLLNTGGVVTGSITLSPGSFIGSTVGVGAVNTGVITASGNAFIDGRVEVGGTVYWTCRSGYTRFGSWCIKNSAGTGTYSEALQGCHDLGANLCDYGALVTCDQVNTDPPGTTTSCQDLTDGSSGDTTWMLTFGAASGDSTFDAFVYEDNNTMDYRDGGEDHYYFCCQPVSSF